MSGTFTARADMLIRQVEGRWSARCEVNQVYAHYQESHPEFHHPRGGQAFYLRDTVYFGGWLHQLSRGLIGADGVNLQNGLRGVAEGMALGVYKRAPVEFNDLRRSGRPYVTRDFAETWSRPAQVGRLAEDDLRMKGRLRYLYGDR